MEIYKCEVADVGDPNQNGNFKVFLSSDVVDVIYTTPYLGPQAQGGFVAIPEKGATVLIVKPNNSPQYFYMSTVAEPSLKANLGMESSKVLPDANETYRSRGVPQRLGFYSPKGSKFVMSDSYSGDGFNVKVEMKSHKEKRVILNDSPAVDAIIIKNEHGDGIKIQTDGLNTITAPSRSVFINSKGPQQYKCEESSMKIVVEEGKELDIHNNSMGWNVSPWAKIKGWFGNINLKSEYQDINLTARAGYGMDKAASPFWKLPPIFSLGRIFLQAMGLLSLIQIDSNGKVIINAGWKGIDLISDGNINMQAKGSIKMQSGLNTTVLTGGRFDSQSLVGTSILSSALVTIDGATINLNEGKSPGVVPIFLIKDYTGYHYKFD